MLSMSAAAVPCLPCATQIVCVSSFLVLHPGGWLEGNGQILVIDAQITESTSKHMVKLYKACASCQIATAGG